MRSRVVRSRVVRSRAHVSPQPAATATVRKRGFEKCEFAYYMCHS